MTFYKYICFCCGKKIETEEFIDGASRFEGGHNYGSTILDSAVSKHKAVIMICDDCLRRHSARIKMIPIEHTVVCHGNDQYEIRPPNYTPTTVLEAALSLAVRYKNMPFVVGVGTGKNTKLEKCLFLYIPSKRKNAKMFDFPNGYHGFPVEKRIVDYEPVEKIIIDHEEE